MSVAQPTSFGALLRRHREAAALSQEDLAERAGLAAKAIGALERGERRRPYPRTVHTLADALRLDDAQRQQFIAAVPRAPAPAVAEGDPFVGRKRELGELTAKLRAAAGGHGGIVMVVGEAGIGKSYLANEFMGAARARGATVLAGRALEGDGQAPYGPWVEAIERYAIEQDADALRKDLGADAAYIAELAPVIRSRVADLARPETLGSNDERLRLFRAVTRVCSSIAARSGALIVLDDLQWADRDTLGVLRYMARTLTNSRVLLVGAYRDPEFGVDTDHPLMTTLASVRHEVACPTIRLGGLAADEIRAYLDHAAGQSLPLAFVDRVLRETNGNPFYAREVLRHVVETETTTGGDGPRTFAMTGVPEGVRQVVGDRLRRLSPPTAQLLRDACGFTTGFAFPVLPQLTQISEGELLDSLDEAVETGLLRAPAAGQRDYEFAHTIVRHALYEGQSHDRRVRLHRRIALALEHAYRGAPEEHAADVAVHYHASAELPGASAGLRYALMAADRARSAYAHDRVVTLLRMAFDLAGETDLTAKAEILTRLALAEAETVRSREAFDTANRALDLMAEAGLATTARAEFLASIAQALKDSGARTEFWDPLVDRGLALIGSQRDVCWARLALLRDRYELVRAGGVGCALSSGQDPEAVAFARASGEENDYAMTLDPLDWRVRAETDAILARVRGWSRPVAVLRGLEVVVRDLVYPQGAFKEGRRAAEELLALASRWGSVSAEADARTQLSWCVLNGGDFAAARAQMDEAEKVARRLGPSHRLHFVPISFAVGLGYFLDADWATVAQDAETYARSTETQRSPVGLAAAAYTAFALARANRPTEARTWLRDLGTVSARVPAKTYLLSRTLAAATAAAWEMGFVEPANAYRRLLLEAEAAGSGDPASFGTLELALARVAALLGEHADAERRFTRAAHDAERSGHRALHAIAVYDHALALRRAGTRDERAESLLARATDGFELLEMRGWVKRARVVRGELRPYRTAGAGAD